VARDGFLARELWGDRGEVKLGGRRGTLQACRSGSNAQALAVVHCLSLFGPSDEAALQDREPCRLDKR